MTRYIDADAYKNHLEFYQWTLKKFYPNCRGLIDRVISLVDDMETVDAVPVIRCKDCKWYGRADKRRFYRGMDCLQNRICTIVPDKDYCPRAERKEE